jgi:crotonobetainyl-CoA:carnitine CoA-transferase CaiB-like acyl-CoA transferase
VAGLYGVIGTLLALIARETSGHGQVVDVASLDALFSSLGTRPLEVAMLGVSPRRQGSRDPFSGPANVFRAADGYLYVHGGTDALFPRLCAAIGRPDLGADERFRTVAGRLTAIEELEAAVTAWTTPRTRAEISASLHAAGIPFGPVGDVADAVGSSQIAAREMLVEIEHATLGALTVMGLPIKLSATPGAIRKAPPMVGEDNERIYGQVLGLTPAEIDDLRASGAI